MKKIFIGVSVICLSIAAFTQSNEAGNGRKAIKQYMNNEGAVPALWQNNTVETIKNILKQYHNSIEKLDITRTKDLFSSDSKIYESGGSEGSYTHYLEHHLAPELKEFKSFTFSDYKVEVQVDSNYAFTTETYNYTIIVARDNTEVKRKGITTSVLKKVKGEWKIMISHNSSRK